MKFLANENFPKPSISFLTQNGFSVSSVADLFQGISDQEVIDKAKADGFIILKFDKDYGEIIFKYGLENPPGIVFFRFKGEAPEVAGKLLRDLIEVKKISVVNKFTVIEKDSIRQRNYSN